MSMDTDLVSMETVSKSSGARPPVSMETAAVSMATAFEESTDRLARMDAENSMSSNSAASVESAMIAGGIRKTEGRKEWLHMDEVETEKLAWLSDLPQPTADSKVIMKSLNILVIEYREISYLIWLFAWYI